MSAVWSFNGVSADTLGVTGVQISLGNMQVDRCSIVMTGSVDSGEAFAYGTQVRVACGGRVVFTGTAMPCARTGDAGTEGQRAEIVGEWWKLQRTQFIQQAPGVNNPGAGHFTGRRRLYVSSTGAAMTTVAMMEEVLRYAQSHGLITGYTGIETLEGGVYPEPEECVDRTVAEVIQTIMRYHMDVVCSFGSGTSLTFMARSGGTRSFSVGTPPLAAVDVMVRSDLVPTGVVLRYEQRRKSQTPSGYKVALSYDMHPGSVRPGDTGVLFETIQLEPGEPFPVGVAQRYYDMFRIPAVVEGTLTLRSEDCDTGVVPGDSINVGGAGSVIQQAFVQSVSEDAMSGETVVTVGLPAFMGVRDLVDIIRLKRRRNRDKPSGDDLVAEDPPGTALTPYLSLVNNRWYIKVTDGEVSDGDHVTVPKWENSSTTLAALVPPSTRILPGADFSVWLYVEFEPEVEEYAVEEGGGNEFYSTGVGGITDCRIQFAVSGARAPEVNPQTGRVTSGRYFFRLGSVRWPTSEPTPGLTVVRTGNLQFMHVPPARLFIFTDNG